MKGWGKIKFESYSPFFTDTIEFSRQNYKTKTFWWFEWFNTLKLFFLIPPRYLLTPCELSPTAATASPDCWLMYTLTLLLQMLYFITSYCSLIYTYLNWKTASYTAIYTFPSYRAMQHCNKPLETALLETQPPVPIWGYSHSVDLDVSHLLVFSLKLMFMFPKFCKKM